MTRPSPAWWRTTDRCSQGARIVRSSVSLWREIPDSGATDIPRKPNYDFERREREKTKAAEAAKKAQAKADKRAAGQAAPDADQGGDPDLR